MLPHSLPYLLGFLIFIFIIPSYHTLTRALVLLDWKIHKTKRAYRAHRNRHKMSPTIHFVRHAQGYHNLSVANHNMRDPPLTPYGEQQCQYLAKTFPYSSTVDLVVASPLKRTVYTAVEAFGHVINKRQSPVVALPELQETSDMPCDTGSDPQDLAKEFSGMAVDLTRVEAGWNSKKGRWAANSAAIEDRCKVARRWLRDRPEKDIVVVTHGGLLHYLTEDWAGMDKLQGMSFCHPAWHDRRQCMRCLPFRRSCPVKLTAGRRVREAIQKADTLSGTGWANAEFRTYTFDPASGDTAAILETEESQTRRRGTEKPLSEAEARSLSRTANNDMKEKGYSKVQPESNGIKVSSKV